MLFMARCLPLNFLSFQVEVDSGNLSHYFNILNNNQCIVLNWNEQSILTILKTKIKTYDYALLSDTCLNYHF